MPIYDSVTNANYGNHDAQDIAVRAFLGLFKDRVDSSTWDDGFYKNCEKSGDDLVPTGAATAGYYLSPLLEPNYDSSGARYFQSRFKHLVWKGTRDSGSELYFHHNTALKSANGGAPYCLYFDGTDDYVEVADAGNLTPAGAVSFDFILNLTATQDYKPILIKNNEYRVRTRYIGAIQSIEMGVYIGAAWHNTDATLWTTGLALDTWYHIRCVYDGAEIRIYVNGVEMPGSTAQAGTITGTANNLWLGWDGGTNYLHGFLDGLLGYSGTLASADFQPPEMSGPPPAERTGAMFLYHMDEGSGATLYDRSGYGSNGTIHGATYYGDGYGWTGWIQDENSTLITDLWYIDPPAATVDSAKGYYYRFKLEWTRILGTEDLAVEYIDTYYQGDISDYLIKVSREQQQKEMTGTQPLMGFTVDLANAVIPGTDQCPDRYFNFDSAVSAFSDVLDSTGCLSVQVGFRNEDGQVDYWRPYIDDLKNNMRSVEPSENGRVSIKGVLCKGLTKDTLDIPLIENVKYNELIRDYLICKDDEDAETEYERYYCDFVDETGQKTLSAVSEWVGESLLCPNWHETDGAKDDPSVWVLPNTCVHAGCSDDKYLYVVFATALQHLSGSVIRCLQVRKCNKDGTPLEDGIVANIFCDEGSLTGTWDSTNYMVASGICTDDNYIYVSYVEQDGDDAFWSVIARVKKTGQNLYSNATHATGRTLRNRYYWTTTPGMLGISTLEHIHGIIAATRPADGHENLWFFSYDPAAAAKQGGRYKRLDIEGMDWGDHAYAVTNVASYAVDEIRPFGFLIDLSTPEPTYRCTYLDFNEGVSGLAYLSTINLLTGAIDQDAENGEATDIGTSEIWDDDPGELNFLWNITVLGQYIYGSLRSTEFTIGVQPETAGINGLGKVARFGYWLDSGNIQYSGATGFNEVVLFDYPLIVVGGEVKEEQGTVTDGILTTDDYTLNLKSGELWFKRVPAGETKEAMPTGIYDADGEYTLRATIRASYDFQPCLQLVSIEKDTERWQAIQNVCDGAGYICCPSPDGRLKFRDRYSEKQIELADAYTLDHDIIYDECNGTDTVKLGFVGEENDGFGGTAMREIWIEFTAYKAMTIDRIGFLLAPIQSTGDPDFPDDQYAEQMLVDIEMGAMHAVNDHTWATAGTTVKEDWDVPYINPDDSDTWVYVDLDTPFVCAAGTTYGIRLTTTSGLQNAVCQWAIRADDTMGDAVTRWSALDGTGGWTNLDYGAATRLESSYRENYNIGGVGEAEGDIIYSYWQEFGQYIDLTFTPSRDIAAGEILTLTAADVDFPALVTAGDIQSDGRDLRVAYSSDGINYNEINRVARALTSTDNARVHFAAQAAMENGSAYPQSYRLYIDNARACPAPETVNGLIYDKFDDRDTTGWTSVSGGWINRYQRMLNNDVAGRQKYINDAMEVWNEQDMVAEATVRHLGAGAGYAGVVVRYLDANNYVACGLLENSDTAVIIVMHGGVWGGVGFEASAAFVNDPGIDYRIQLVATGTDFYLYVDGTLITSLSCNFGDDPTYDQAGLFAGGLATETLDSFLAYRYYGAIPAISGVLAHTNAISPEYDTIKVVDYNRKKTYTRNTDYQLGVAAGELYIKRISTGDVDDEDVVYTQYGLAPVYDFYSSVKRSRSDDRYGNSIRVIGHRRFPSDVPLTVTKYIDVPRRKAADEDVILTAAASPVQRIYGSKQEDWRDDQSQFETDVDLSGFGMDINFEAPFILGEPLIVVKYGDASEYFGTADVPFNYPLPAGYDGGNWDGGQVWDTPGMGASVVDLYFKAVRIGYVGAPGTDFPTDVAPMNIRIGNYREWRKLLGVTYYGATPSGNVFGSYANAGWYWRLKHMNDNWKGLGTKLMWYPSKSIVLSSSSGITTLSNLIASQRKSLYIEVTPVDYYGNFLFDDDALDPNGDDIADEHKLHIVSVEPTSDGIKIRALNRTGDVQRIRVLISGYQANINKVLQVIAEDEDEILTHGRRKLQDYESEYISTSALAYRRAAEILALNMDEEEQPKDVPLNRFHVDIETYDVISLSDKDAAMDKVLYRVLGWKDSLSIEGFSQTTATALMRLPAQ